MKTADSPLARVIGPNTGVLVDGWFMTTTTLVSVAFPELLTVPEKNSGCPTGTGAAGQATVTATPGVVRLGQTLVRATVMLLPVERAFAFAVNVSIHPPHDANGVM